KEQWLRICETAPASLIPTGSLDSDVGPIQALIDEPEYNSVVAKRNLSHRAPGGRGAQFLEVQFLRAISLGSISLLQDELKGKILAAYAAMDRANKLVAAEIQEDIHHYG